MIERIIGNNNPSIAPLIITPSKTEMKLYLKFISYNTEASVVNVINSINVLRVNDILDFLKKKLIPAITKEINIDFAVGTLKLNSPNPNLIINIV
jgi:hypothetical protein